MSGMNRLTVGFFAIEVGFGVVFGKVPAAFKGNCLFAFSAWPAATTALAAGFAAFTIACRSTFTLSPRL
jgi:hypothetical protein